MAESVSLSDHQLWTLVRVYHGFKTEAAMVEEFGYGLELNVEKMRQAFAAISVPATARLWRSRIDCWYEPHRDIGQKSKDPMRIVRWVVLEAPNSEEAIKRALDWAERTASPSQGRRWLRFDHRQTGSFPLPWDLGSTDGTPSGNG